MNKGIDVVMNEKLKYPFNGLARLFSFNLPCSLIRRRTATKPIKSMKLNTMIRFMVCPTIWTSIFYSLLSYFFFHSGS